MNKTKVLKYYALIFLTAVIAISIYTLVLYLRGEIEGGFSSIFAMFLIPVVFVGFLFIFDKIFNLLIPAKYKNLETQKTEYEVFLDQVNQIVGAHLEISLEESRKLRENERFQKSLSQVFTILKHGENNELSWEYLQKKFKKDSTEFEALNIIIESVKKS